MKRWENILHWFQAIPRGHQIGLMTGLISIIILTIIFSIWTLSPSYAVLFSHMDTRDANLILTQLEASHIPYQVRNHGQDILIDKRLVDKTRIKLMGSPIPFSHSVGFELFDKTDFGMTDFSQKINYQRALQGELERTISSLDEVQQARVQLSIPDNHLFQQEHNLPRAAVTLHLKHKLTALQIKSIQQLVTASVAHLPLKNVVIVDQNGNGLIRNEDDTLTNHFSEKKKIETYLTEKVMQLLRPIFETQPIMVKIDVTLNYDELTQEREKPQQHGIIAHEKESRHSSTVKSDKNPGNQDFSREKSYQLGHEKERFIRANGTIQRLTASVVLPEQTPSEKTLQIERLVKSVIGFDAKRGDLISVEALIETHSMPTTPIFKTTALHPVYESPFFIVAISLIGGGLTFIAIRYRRRLKQRQMLLAELDAWLTQHE